ncbi:MAG: lysozyme [Eubacterium sp.]|nr:lysozyme [Eubacterium sp.]
MKLKTWHKVLIALAIGILIGIIAGCVSGGRIARNMNDYTSSESKKEEKEKVKPTVTPTPEISSSSVSESSEEAVDPEEYKEYLSEASEELSTETGNINNLSIYKELYSELVNGNYPRHDYDTSAFGVSEKTGKREYLDTKNYVSRSGIDVSEYNGEVDWTKVRDAGYEFVFIRLGYRGYESGHLNLDVYFKQNLEGAKAAGLDVGVYFFSQAISREEAREEAAYVIENLGGTELQLPIMYDCEVISFDKARTDNQTGKEVSENTAEFCAAIEKAGYRAGYYANLKWEFFMLDMELLKDYEVWFAGYEELPSTPYKFNYWQYSDKGEVPGIAAETDLNLQMIPADQVKEDTKKAEEQQAGQQQAEQQQTGQQQTGQQQAEQQQAEQQ